MKLQSRTCLRTFSLLALIVPISQHSTAVAATLTYPSAPCGTTLQACIVSASPGDTVQVATNVPIGESLTIDKSLTLRPAPGFSPLINNGARVSFFNPPSKSNSVVFEGFTIDAGDVRALQNSSQHFDVQIRDLVFPQTYLDRPPIDIGTNISGPFGLVTFGISNNKITISQSINGVSAISVNGGYATGFQGTIHDNTIVDLAGIGGAGIFVGNATSELAVDVIRNQITGTNFNDGIQFHQFDSGSANVRMINNLVAGQVSEGGQPGAVAIRVSNGSATFLVANNTLADSEQGISISGNAAEGATWNGVVANNIVANVADWGFIFEDPSTSVINENNLVFNTGMNYFTPGPGTLFLDPQFIGGGNYRLSPGSPARDAGNNARVPSDITIDLAGMPRIQGSAVEMGAYEMVPEPNGLVLLLLAALCIAGKQSKRTCKRRCC